uniref:LigA protein n=1 Tax=Streptomyces sp. NBC_01393 TaxID=2903851 RepID=A0AAU3I079_9ACTN
MPDHTDRLGRPGPDDSLDVTPVAPVPPVDENGFPSPAQDEADDGAADDPAEDAHGQDAHDQDTQARLHEERRAEEAEKEKDGKGYDDLRLVQQRVYNNFYASVDASGAAFGFAAGARTGLAPGIVEPETVDRALRFYVRPQPCFDEALGRLSSDSLVVLTGQDGCGRGAGALALLREVAGDGASLRSLSPANALADLVTTMAVEEGHAYVIRDYVGETNAEAVQEYGVGRLSDELRRKGAFLVITAGRTTSRRLALSDHCVQWRGPDPLELFRHCRERLAPVEIDPDTERELLEGIAEQRRPADVVAAAEALAENPRKAVELLRDGDSKIVQDWFAAKPSADDLLPIAALAFLEGVPERTFEGACALLLARMRTWELTGETPVEPEAATTLPPHGTGFEQSRARWNDRAVGLVHVERRPGPGQDVARSERRLVFTSPRIRDLVIGELHGLYGYKLWYPLRQWLGDLSRLPDLDARTEVARGTAVLARYALTEVEEHLLRNWAEGITSQRVTAALTLQFMCEAEHLAPQALNIALGWADNSGPGRAVTTAMALTGKLGSLYRLEALNWCWFLTGRGERIAFAARRSLVLLLQTAEQEPERALLTLRYVRTRLVATAKRSKEHADALRTVVQLLEAERLEEPGPVVATLLRQGHDNARHLGALWAAVLFSSFRRRAVRALCRTLVHLREDPGAIDAVRRLGEAMRAASGDRQWNALAHALSGALRDPDFAVPGTRQLAAVLVGSLRGAPHSDRA